MEQTQTTHIRNYFILCSYTDTLDAQNFISNNLVEQVFLKCNNFYEIDKTNV